MVVTYYFSWSQIVLKMYPHKFLIGFKNKRLFEQDTCGKPLGTHSRTIFQWIMSRRHSTCSLSLTLTVDSET